MAKKKFDFTGVESYQRAPEGTFIAKVSKIEETTFQGGNDGFKITFEIVKGAGKGCRVIENFPFVDTALWKLKNFFVACGLKADGRVQIDTDKLIGKLVEITVFHEEYNNSLRAKISDINKIINTSDDDDEDDDDEVDEKESEDEEDDDDEDEEEEPEPVKKTAKKSSKTAPKAKEKSSSDKSTKKDKKPAKKAEKEPEEDDDDDWDDDWDDEE